MNIKGSPTAIELFGLQDDVSDSQDLFDDLPEGSITDKQQFTTPNKKRPCFRSPKLNPGKRSELISPLSAAISNSVQGVYCSQEIKDQDNNLKGEVWNILKALRDKTDVLLPYNIKNILQGKSLYRGKVAHISALVKSVESVSQKDTSIVLHDNTGEIRAAVHNKVMEKHGALLQPGVGLLLRQCTVFSFITVQKYVNITLPNIVHVYNSSSLHPNQEVIDKHILEVSEINVQKIENPDTENQTPNVTLNTPNRPPPPRPPRNVYRPTTPQNNSRGTTQQSRSRTNTPQNNSRTNTPQNNPRTNTPQNNSRTNTTQNNPRTNTPQNNPRTNTPQNNPRTNTPQNNPRTNTPQNNPRTNTPQNNPRTNTPQSKTNPHTAPHYSGNKTTAPSNQTPQKSWTPQRNRFQQKNSTPVPKTQTPQRSSHTPQRGNHPAANNGSCSTPVRGSVFSTGSVVGSSAGPSSVDQNESKKRSSGEGEGGVGKKIKTTPPLSKVSNNSNISPKEQAEIAKLLEDIDDSFFDEF